MSIANTITFVVVEIVGAGSVIRAGWAQYSAPLPAGLSEERRHAAETARRRIGTWDKHGWRLGVAFAPTFVAALVLWPIMVVRVAIAYFGDRRRAANFVFAAVHGRLRASEGNAPPRGA